MNAEKNWTEFMREIYMAAARKAIVDYLLELWHDVQ